METTNDLRFSTIRTKKGIDYVIKIRLNDECKNGHNDFSITGDMYTAGKQYTDRNNQGSGAIGDEIAAMFPEFKIFNDLHLCDAKGAPMYAEANGFYHLKNTGKGVTMNYLRITEDEYQKISIAEDKEFFKYLLESLNIPERWEQEAKIAIAKLEKLTGKKFKDDSKRYQFTPLSLDKMADIGNKINQGFYNTDAIAARERQKLADKKQAVIDSITADRDRTIQKAKNEFNVQMHVLNCGLTLDNFIYYSHTNIGAFNWKSYDKKVTPEQLEYLQSQGTPSNLPAGIVFEFAKDK